MAGNRNYAALIPSAIFEVRGAEIEIKKIGSRAALRKLSRHPALAPFVEQIGDQQVEKGNVSKEALKGTFDSLAASRGGFALVQDLIDAVNQVVTDLIADDAVVETEEQREGLRAMVETFDFNEDLDCLGAWVKLNLPQAYGPFTRSVPLWRAGKTCPSGVLVFTPRPLGGPRRNSSKSRQNILTTCSRPSTRASSFTSTAAERIFLCG